MTKTSFIPTSAVRLIVAWVVIALLTISIMKVGAATSQNSRLPIFQAVPSLSFHNMF